MSLSTHAIAVNFAEHSLNIIGLLPSALSGFFDVVSLDHREICDQICDTLEAFLNQSMIDQGHAKPLSEKSLPIRSASTIHVVH
jgi:hypothetical protein